MKKEFITILRFNEKTQTFDRLHKYKDGTEKYFSRGVDRSKENTK